MSQPDPAAEPPLAPEQLQQRLANSVLAFRGYNVTNLGRTPELLAHPRYGEIVRDFLVDASRICQEVTGRPTDLVARVRERRETELASYADAISLVVAVELAQLRLLKEFFEIDVRFVRASIGYSLGEIAAAIAGGVLAMQDAMRIPLALAEDSVALAEGVTLGILFSRGDLLPNDDIVRLCLEINQAGDGVIGISTFLSPNSLLVMGQGTTVDRFRQRMKQAIPGLHLRRNDQQWPPLHSPIMWQRAIPNRAAVLMHAMPVNMIVPVPPILSLVTGKMSYTDLNARDLLHRWVDHPQRLWDALYESLSMGVDTMIHVGPEPNLIPATMSRLRENVEAQARQHLGMRALSAAVRRSWILSLLPQRTALLRAPLVKQVILEDWLLAQKP